LNYKERYARVYWVADGGDALKIWRVTVTIVNKQ